MLKNPYKSNYQLRIISKIVAQLKFLKLLFLNIMTPYDNTFYIKILKVKKKIGDFLDLLYFGYLQPQTSIYDSDPHLHSINT